LLEPGERQEICGSSLLLAVAISSDIALSIDRYISPA
jgi:hypothetical protein